VNPYLGATVLVNVNAAHNNGGPLAPALVTAVNADGSVNVRVMYDGPQLWLGRHRPEWLTGVQFHDTTDPQVANRAGSYGAFWPDGPDVTTILDQMEAIMAAQDDVNAAVSAVQAVTADLTAATANIAAEIANLNSELAAAGQPTVNTSALNAALAPLQAAQAAVDALETPAAAAPAAPAGGTAGSTVSAGDTGASA